MCIITIVHANRDTHTQGKDIHRVYSIRTDRDEKPSADNAKNICNGFDAVCVVIVEPKLAVAFFGTLCLLWIPSYLPFQMIVSFFFFRFFLRKGFFLHRTSQNQLHFLVDFFCNCFDWQHFVSTQIAKSQIVTRTNCVHYHLQKKKPSEKGSLQNNKILAIVPYRCTKESSLDRHFRKTAVVRQNVSYSVRGTRLARSLSTARIHSSYTPLNSSVSTSSGRSFILVCFHCFHFSRVLSLSLCPCFTFITPLTRAHTVTMCITRVPIALTQTHTYRSTTKHNLFFFLIYLHSVEFCELSSTYSDIEAVVVVVV